MQSNCSFAVAVSPQHLWQLNGGDASAIDTDPNALVLERLPSGNYAWLRPETDARYLVTDRGRRDRGAVESK